MAFMDEDAARSARIIKHMNKDHGVSLCAFARLPPTADVKMTAIALDSMTLAVNGKVIVVPIDPPMKDYTESRQRLASMSAKSCKAMGYSHYIVDDYSPPDIMGFLVITFVCIAMKAWNDPGAFLSDGWAREIFFFGNETLSDFNLKWSRELFWTTAVVHIGEAIYFWKSKILYYHCTSWTYRLLWMVNVTLEGFTCFRRFNGLVEEVKFKHMS